MRFNVEYEIVPKDGDAEITEYAISFGKTEDRRIPQKRVTCDMKTALDLLNRCKLQSWDGFYGKHPKRVKDGTMFTLRAVVNGGKKIYAHGSQNFPRHYHELNDGLYELFDKKEEDAG